MSVEGRTSSCTEVIMTEDYGIPLHSLLHAVKQIVHSEYLIAFIGK